MSGEEFLAHDADDSGPHGPVAPAPATVRRETDDVEVVRGHVRSADFRRVSHGLFVPRRTDLDDPAEWQRDLRAWLAVLAPSSVFTGLTAARLSGWWLPALDPDTIPVFAATSASEPVVRRAGLVNSEYARGRGHAPRVVGGLPVDSGAEVLLRCARDLDLVDLVPLVESALRLRGTSRSALESVCAERRPGVVMLRRASALAEIRSESPMETLLRLFLMCLDVNLEVQPVLRDDRGNFIARVDLRVKGTNLILEYDGAGHRDLQTHREDLRRDRRLVATGSDRLGYTLGDLVGRPAVVMDELDRTLGRRERLARLQRWRTLVDRSSHSAEGRHRILSRWATPMGVFIPH